jgi:hypothetical protein
MNEFPIEKVVTVALTYSPEYDISLILMHICRGKVDCEILGSYQVLNLCICAIRISTQLMTSTRTIDAIQRRGPQVLCTAVRSRYAHIILCKLFASSSLISGTLSVTSGNRCGTGMTGQSR